MAWSRKDYYLKNRDRILAYNREWRRKNYNKARSRERVYRDEVIRLWNEYLTEKLGDPVCQICGRILTWMGYEQDKTDSVHFDHRHGPGKIIGDRPNNWIKSRKPTPDNIVIFEDEDFGILCLNCNICLPTNNRKDWVMKVLQYLEESEE